MWKNTENLNTKISKLNEELSDCKTDLHNYKRGLSQVEARLVEFKEHDVKYYERIRVLERDVEIRDNKNEYLKNELEQVKKEKESLDNKLTGFENASKGLDSLLGSQISDKNKEGLGYNAILPLLLKSIHLLRKICLGQGNPQNNIDDKGYWDSGCSRHMTGNMSYLSEYEPYDGGYVSFGHGGGKITVVTDDFSRFTWTFFLRTKDETSSILRNFITEIENLKDLKVKIITCDNRGEFKNKEMNELCTKKDHLGKFDAKRDEGYFVGYSMSSKTFRVFNKRTKKVEENMHVDFLENKLIEKGVGPNWLFDIDTLTNSMNYVPVAITGTPSTNISGTKDVATSKAVKKDVSSLRYIALLNWFHEAHMETSNDTIRNSDKQDDYQKEQDCNADVPKSSGISNPIVTSKVPLADQVEPAVSLTAKYDILTASLHVLTVFLDTSPKSSSDPSWVKAIQEELLQFKIQNVCVLVDCPKGEEGIDYKEVFAPVGRFEAVRLFLAYVSLMGFIVYQMDVKSSFLCVAIDEEVYVMQPPRFQDPEFLDKVYKVEKAMYGFHQAPRAWYGTLSKYLLDNGFQRGTIDQTLFIRKHKGEFLLVQVYVDDIIFGSSNPQLCREFEALMHDKFQMSAMGKDGPGKDVELHLYRSMIGSLMYLTTSRPDIMFIACACARHQVTPKECHLYDVKRIFRYLKGHLKLGLWYLKESSFDLVAYSDSDYDCATQDRKSTSGGCQFLGSRLISWQCKMQTIVATSTTKAEYVAATSGCGQVLWIQNQMLYYGYNFMNTKIYIDNNSAICIVKTTVYHSKTKHIEIRHHFIRDCYEKKLINMNHIHTDENVADLLTKSFDVGRFQYLVVSIGMLDP
nr:hypothetical protein [Tanacetum cinerariifolium]